MRRSILLLLASFFISASVIFVFSQKACDHLNTSTAEKKLPFNHKSHITLHGAQDCGICHGYYEDGRFMGLPSVGRCVSCHKRSNETPVRPGAPSTKKAFESYSDMDHPWQSNARQRPIVYFSHKVAMTARFDDGRQKVQCSSCHGDKAGSETTEQILGALPMDRCVECHEALGISRKCMVCHQ